MERLEGARPTILSRASLIADLGPALEPESPPSLLVLFGFNGLKEYLEAARLETATAWEAKERLQQLGAQVARNVPSSARVYASRRGEFCVLCPAEAETSWMRIAATLDGELWSSGMGTCFVVMKLPGEASTAAGLLRLADLRLRAQYGALRPRGSTERI